MSRSPFRSIIVLVEKLQALNKQAVREYTPVVESILRSRSRDAHNIEHTLNGLLSFCGYEPALQLYKKLCRHYLSIDLVATADYVYAYREMWDSEQKEKKPLPLEKRFQKVVAKTRQLKAKKPRGKKGK